METSVSIIIPVFNVDIYLPSCLDSVLSQTRENIEVICVNDCSPDGSRQILASRAAGDERMVILDHAQNKGLAAARNTGLASARGKYVYFLDSDDVLYAKDSISHLYEIAEQDSADVVVGATLRWDEQTGEQSLGYHKQYLQQKLAAVQFKDYPSLRHNAVAWNKLLNRAFLQHNGVYFNTDLRKFEDNDFSWRVHLLAKSISLTTQPTYLHRLRADKRRVSIMQDKERDVDYHVLSAKHMLDFLEKNRCFDNLRHYFDSYFFLWCYHDVQELVGRKPSRSRKVEMLEQYFSVLSRVPEKSLAESTMLGRYREGIRLMRQGLFDEAWHVFAVQDFQAYCQKNNDCRGSNINGTGKLSGLMKFMGSWRIF